MTEFVRSIDAHFDTLADWPYRPHDHLWDDLRVRYVDEGPTEGPVMLLLHGMPTWAYLYRDMIPNHFLQNTHGAQVAEHILRRIAEDR